MKNKIFKTSIILLMILTMTMANFVFVGKGLISYAQEAISTNHQNVEFKAYFKDADGNEVTTLSKESKSEELFLYLHVNVKNEGYFNGEISLENSNFTLKETDSEYVNKIENNTVYLNQINVGRIEDIKVRIEPIVEENFDIGLLNIVSKVNLKGIYRDSKQKDINIKSSRDLKFEFVENNTNDNVINEMQVITNKLLQIDGEQKRIVQLSYNMGLQENNYPIKEINSNIAIPTIDEKQAEIVNVSYLNNMTSLDYKYDGNNVELKLTNLANNENRAVWKSQGVENIILTLIYDESVNVENAKIGTQEKITLYNDKQIEKENEISIGAEEIDSIIQIDSRNSETNIYKGKMYAGIPRQYQSTTDLKVNYAKPVNDIQLVENESNYVIGDTNTNANVIYSQTTIKKEEFDKIFGENGTLTICDQKGEIIETVTNSSSIDNDGNIVISYSGKDVKKLDIKTSNPVKEGTLHLNHVKTIVETGDTVKNATELKTEVTEKYNSNTEQRKETSIKLENTTTKATITVDKEDLSTVVSNDVKIKVNLFANDEKYDLYANPQVSIQLPEQVENITINSVDILYEDELSIKDYQVDGRNINIALEGIQTQYKEDVVEGAIIDINAKLDINKKSATTDSQIQMTYTNGKQVTYESGEIGTESAPIKIVAPKDVTTIYSIKDLGIETLGQEEKTQVMLEKGVDERQVEAQIEVINNNKDSIENVKILGELPTNNDENNMGIEIVDGITLQGVENTKVYYSENNKATDDLDNESNGWKETIEDLSEVNKYLIVAENIPSQASIQGNYTYKIPANLDYNQVANTSYKVKNTDSATKVESEINSTVIRMDTGVGPIAEANLTATKGGQEINGPVKNGEIIRYTVQVSNVGTEDIENISVVGQVPEGTVRVEPEENYEYTGASYYEEIEGDSYETTIESLKVGEVANVYYEVRVNSKIDEGTVLKNVAQISYKDVKKQSNEIQNITAKGNIRVSVKRVTDRKVQLYESDTVSYYAIIENISDEKQENLKVETNIPDNLTVERLELITGMERIDGKYVISPDENIDIQDIPQTNDDKGQSNQEIKKEVLKYSKQIDIGSLEPGETKVLSYSIGINKLQKDDQINFGITVDNNQESYESNELKDNVAHIDVGLTITADTQGQYVKSGDSIKYVIEIENKSNTNTNTITIKDSIPKQLSIDKIVADGRAITEIGGNEISVPISLSAKETTTVEIDTLVNYSPSRDKAEAITNIASAELYGEKIATTSAINHIIQANDGSVDPNGNNDVGNNDIANGNRTITGVAWYDANANGQKDAEETTLSGIKVKLLNTETNNLVKNTQGSDLEATTNENGVYILDKIGNGKYIVIFEYDKSQYGLTKYKVAGVADTENSDVALNKLLIGNETKEVAATDMLEINNNNISNIDAGFIKLQNFDLKLDKYIGRILIQNASGTTVREYDNSNLAKAEIPGKYLNGTTVIIEYKINVTNNGEVEGYAKKIADYAPADLKFSSELNKDWYQVGNTLYTEKLANEKIKAGETKTITLTLTKTMTENNTGSIANIAEIVEDYNELGIKDSNSTPGNRIKTENDYSIAEAIISVKTGGMVYAIGAVIATIVILGIVTIVIVIKKKNNDNLELQ